MDTSAISNHEELEIAIAALCRSVILKQPVGIAYSRPSNVRLKSWRMYGDSDLKSLDRDQ